MTPFAVRISHNLSPLLVSFQFKFWHQSHFKFSLPNSSERLPVWSPVFVLCRGCCWACNWHSYCDIAHSRQTPSTVSLSFFYLSDWSNGDSNPRRLVLLLGYRTTPNGLCITLWHHLVSSNFEIQSSSFSESIWRHYTKYSKFEFQSHIAWCVFLSRLFSVDCLLDSLV